MSVRIRANPTEDPVSELNVHRYPPEWAQFNLARRICQMPTKAARATFVANLRFKETPEFMIDLDIEVQRQWPLRHAPIQIPAKLIEIMQQPNTEME